MADKNGSKFKVISLVITLGLLFASIIATWTVYGKDISHNADSITAIKDKTIPLIKVKGCEPSSVNKLNIALVKKDIETIQKSQTKMEDDLKDMRKEQSAGFKEILGRLPK